MTIWRDIREDLACGLSLLTRLPTGWLRVEGSDWSLGRSLWCWPLTGAGVGAVGGALYLALTHLGLPPLLSAIWTAAALLLLTGGLHEDGLADMADGLGGGRDRRRKLDIMRDSRLGSYGAMALILALALRVSALSFLGGASAMECLIASGALSRASMAGVAFFLPPARPDGLARQLEDLSAIRVTLTLLIAAVPVFLAFPPLTAVLTCAGSTGMTALLMTLSFRQLGGHTGDVLGATACLVDCTALTILIASVPG
ncbi:adenosylcobinamide-GDP ribazoletransferase [Gluconobacter sp. Dm-62]|uniref:adenosylcobinamide-GDP ribazoletransferase n=1 Tax=Gluconobacter sp. Dm-62 TaxID=2799804 RepID=UPI001B8B9A71|nr:adenosylcobinamide-GDP ribazoletransferase [Gluconobacter sp. Dm-62]MBS1103590.1 adenosylcobinamide-GDP ribazoletransferase [Gluconobacter sp. Dm-62]